MMDCRLTRSLELLMRPTHCVAFILLLLGMVMFVSASAAEKSSDADIRAARQAFNQSILDQDVSAIGKLLAPEYHITTGRSQQSHGVEEELQSWSSLFGTFPDFYCQRDIRELRVNQGWGLAEELGNWHCHYSLNDESIHSSGVYAAKWQLSTDDRWLIQSEVFTTLTCVGNDAGCKPPAPID